MNLHLGVAHVVIAGVIVFLLLAAGACIGVLVLWLAARHRKP